MLPKKSIHILFDESNNELSIKTNEKQAASVNLKQNTIIRNNKTELDKEEVVRINNEIANHANRKELKEAKAKFDYLKNNQAINSHSYAIMINAYVRCGDIISSTALFDEILRRKWRIDIITFTTVMKGYCNECSLIKALELFSIMLTMNPPVQPNIRTINTFLRGCIITGNVMLAEEYFNKAKKEYHLQLDCSSYEYMIKLYCQALDIDKVSPMIGRLKENHTIISSLHFIYYDISRAYALLGDWKLLQRYLKLIDENITNDTSAVQEYDNQEDVVTSSYEARGGKRAWKDMMNESRSESLQLFQFHRNKELADEINHLKDYHHDYQHHSLHDYLHEIQSYFYRILLFMPIIRNIPLNKSKKKKKKKNNQSIRYFNDSSMPLPLQLQFNIENHFGYKQLYQKLKSVSHQSSMDSVKSISLTQSSDHAMFEHLFDSSNHLHLHQLFSNDYHNPHNQKIPKRKRDDINKPIKLEICSGAGEWAIAQAERDQESYWITMELRLDRVYQTFFRAITKRVSNLAMIGGDAMTIIPNHIKSDSVDIVVVNHPEPPQQTGGLTSQAKHLLDTSFFSEMGRILKADGVLTILTDNLWYGKLLVRQQAQNPTGSKDLQYQLKSISKEYFINHQWHVECEEVFSEDITHDYYDGKKKAAVTLLEGKPGKECGYNVDASSYFDRLWKRDDKMKRYFLVFHKSYDIQMESHKKSSDKKPKILSYEEISSHDITRGSTDDINDDHYQQQLLKEIKQAEIIYNQFYDKKLKTKQKELRPNRLKKLRNKSST